jgi:site-specific recombinase XerD
MLVSFCDWMRPQRGASDATLSIYRFELRAFIKELGEDPRIYDARNLRQFVLDKNRRSGWAPTRKSICAIRMFLRFLIAQGRCPASLYASIPGFVHWRPSALPRYLQPDQVEIIASADPKTPIGSRNRAIFLLLARLGCRAGDVVRLRFSDLDWKEGMIRVSGKGRRETVLPLSQEIGDALAAYIKDHRPPANTDAVFVRSSAPYRRFTESTAISIIVARAMRSAGIKCPKPGAAHVLRHSVASSMLRGGVSLQEIAAVLRVPTKKSVLIEGVELAARRGGVQGNVRTPRFPALLASPLPSNSGRSARGEPGTPSSASCAAARAPKPSSAIAILRPTRLGLALQSLAQLALRLVHCETRDRHRLAPPRLSAVLEMEKQSSSWSTVGADRSPKPDPTHEFSEPTLGCTSRSW